MLRIGCVFFIVAAVSSLDMPALHVKFSLLGKPGVDSFFALPRTNAEAEKAKWVQPEESKGNSLFDTHCQAKDGEICILTDKMGSICGYQISIPTSVDNSNIPGFNYTRQGFITQKLFGTEYYSNQIFFVSQETIAEGGREFNNQTGDSLWLQTGTELVEIPENQAGMDGTDFVKQNCFVRMGLHYFYKADKSLKEEDFRPWFTLYDSEELIGFGFIAFGSKDKHAKATTWFEDVTAAAIQAIAPSSPEWVFKYIDTYGIFAHHVFFSPEPWKTKCKSNNIENVPY